MGGGPTVATIKDAQDKYFHGNKLQKLPPAKGPSDMAPSTQWTHKPIFRWPRQMFARFSRLTCFSGGCARIHGVGTPICWNSAGIRIITLAKKIHQSTYLAEGGPCLENENDRWIFDRRGRRRFTAFRPAAIDSGRGIASALFYLQFGRALDPDRRPGIGLATDQDKFAYTRSTLKNSLGHCNWRWPLAALRRGAGVVRPPRRSLYPKSC